MCDITDPRILNAYISITEHDPTDWLILGYKGTRDVISLYACGENGLSEFRDNLTDEILFGFIRIEDKFVLITYVPDAVSGVRRARALVHSRAVANILELSHTQLTASSLSDLSDGNIRTRLKLGQYQIPNRSRPAASKRASVITRRRKSGTFSPAPSPSPMSERNLRIHINSMDDYYDDFSDRMTATPTPSTPTSVTSSSYTNEHYFAIAEPPLQFSSLTEEQERKRIQEQTEDMLQTQLARKKELEEARFRQFQQQQQEEKIRREQTVRRIEEEKRIQQQQQKEKEIPPWQLQLKQRKEQQKESRQQKLQPQQQQQQQQQKEKEIPLWQQQLQQRKLQKQQQLEKEKAQIEERLREQRQARIEKQREAELLKQRSVSPTEDKQEQQAEPIRAPTPTFARSPTPQSVRSPTPQSIRAPTPQSVRAPTPTFARSPTPQSVRAPTPQPQPQPVRAPTPQPVRAPTPTLLAVEEPIHPAVQESTPMVTSIAIQEPTPMVTQIPAAVTQINVSAQETNEGPSLVSPAPLHLEQVPLNQNQKDLSTTREIPVMTGFVSVQTNTSPFWKRRHFILYADQMLLYKDELSKEAMYTIPFTTVKRIAPADEDEDTYVANSYMIDTQQGLSFQILADDKKTGRQIYTKLQQLL